jgi:ketopantoate reductase
MRISIIGAGGTGGYFGGLLARAGEQVSFLARGTQLEALRTHGLTVKSRLAGTFALPVDIVERSSATLQALEPEAMGSMAFDLLAGRRLELEALNGTMVRLGHEHGLSLPFNVAIYAALKPYANGAQVKTTEAAPHSAERRSILKEKERW